MDFLISLPDLPQLLSEIIIPTVPQNYEKS